MKKLRLILSMMRHEHGRVNLPEITGEDLRLPGVKRC